MSTPLANAATPDYAKRRFATTRWSLVLQARNGESQSSRMALSELCEAYWLPLYAFVRRHSKDADQAQDLTQAFFAVILEKDYLDQVKPSLGRFRSFLLASVKHFLSNERDKARTLKRGGGIKVHSLDWKHAETYVLREPADSATAESLFEREWALALLDRVLDRLRAEQHASGKRESFEVLHCFLADARNEAYTDAAARLNVSEAAARVAVHRLRKRYRKILREEIAETTESSDQIEDEIRHLFAALAN